MIDIRRFLPLPLLLLTTASATGQTYSIKQDGARAARDIAAVAMHRRPGDLLAEHRALDAALSALKPQRPGVVDAYVIAAGLDSDRVFDREAAEAGRVLARRFDARERTIVLTAGANGAVASPANLAIALARIGELADKREDVVVVYTTSHGSAEEGLAYRDAARGQGSIGPARYPAMLDDAGIANRLIIVSACYSGIFVPRLVSATSVVMSAAAADRSSFGCEPGNDWTFFGDALINRALRKNQPLAAAFTEADGLVSGWEAAGKMDGSRPQIRVGADVGKWLDPLEKRRPVAATKPVGRSPAGASASAS